MGSKRPLRVAGLRTPPRAPVERGLAVFGPLGSSSGLRAPGVVARARLPGVVLGFKLAEERGGVHGGGDEERPAEERAFFDLVKGQARAKVEATDATVALPARVRGGVGVQQG
jgi:hypothetical protein